MARPSQHAGRPVLFAPSLALALGAALSIAACGGQYAPGDELSQGSQADEAMRSTLSISGCFKDRTRKRTTRRTALHLHASGTSKRIGWVPKEAVVRLWDRNHDGRVCAKKANKSQPYSFYSVKYDGKLGWIRRNNLTSWAQPAYISRCNHVCGNCVYYARCRQPKLPSGLTSYQDKVRIIDSKRAFPGCVAIIKTSHYYGHVAYVYEVAGTTIHLSEANWARSCPSTRSGTKAGLNITGFWCP